MIGLIIGFGCTGVFILFSLFNIIIDEVQRHDKFKEKVEKAKTTLVEEYEQTEAQLDAIMEEFQLKESKGEKFDEEEERKALKEIN